MSEESLRNSPPQSSPPSGEGVRRDARPAPTHARPRVFLRLIRHFLMRLVRGGHESETTEFEFGAGPLLGILCTPGACFSFLLFQKYSTLRDWIMQRPAARSLRLFRTRQIFLHLFSDGGCGHPDSAEMGQNSAGLPGLPEPCALAVTSAHDLPGQRWRYRLRGRNHRGGFQRRVRSAVPPGCGLVWTSGHSRHCPLNGVARRVSGIGEPLHVLRDPGAVGDAGRDLAARRVPRVFFICARGDLDRLGYPAGGGAFRAAQPEYLGAILSAALVSGALPMARRPRITSHGALVPHGAWRRSRLPSSGWWRHMRWVTGAASRA